MFVSQRTCFITPKQTFTNLNSGKNTFQRLQITLPYTNTTIFTQTDMMFIILASSESRGLLAMET
jgi:hypothetical protein